MKKVKEVRKVSTKERLEEITGKVIFSEEDPLYGLLLKIDECYKYISWEGVNANIRVGDIIRGFYEEDFHKAIKLMAYELLNEQGDVLFRASSNSRYRFVEE